MAGQGAKGGGQVAMPAAQAMGGPSIVMPNGMSSGDVNMGGNVSVATGPIDTGFAAGPSAGSQVGPRIPLEMGDINKDIYQGPPLQQGPNELTAMQTPPSSLPVAIPQPPTAGGLKGGIFGQQPRPMPRPSQAQYAPLAPQGQFNVNQAAAGALQQAMGATQQGLGFTPMGIAPQSYRPTMQRVSGTQQAFGYKPAQQQAQLLADTDISQYQNPYQQQVIDIAMRDIGSAQQQALMQQGAQAQQARAFGGSRQGIAEAETRLGYGQQAADTAAKLRQQGFQQAQQAAMFDVGQRAATEAANVAARTGAAQYGAGARTAAQLGNIQRAQQVQAANAAAQMQAAQYAAQERAAAQRANLAAQQSAMGTRLGAASQLAGLGQQAFGTGQAIQQQQMQQGLLQQMLQQSLIDAAKAQYAGYTGAPSAALAAPLAALGATPDQSTTTKSFTPGLFNYLQLGASMFPRPR